MFNSEAKEWMGDGTTGLRSQPRRTSGSPESSDSGVSSSVSSSSLVNTDICEVYQTLLASLSGVVQYETLLGIGAVGIGPRGEVALNGQVIEGFNLSNIHGIPQHLLTGQLHPLSLQPDNRHRVCQWTTSTGNNARASQSGSAATCGVNRVPPGLRVPTGEGSTPPKRDPTRFAQAEIRLKYGQLGDGICEFNTPHGFCVDATGGCIIADTNNHRIQIFSKHGDPIRSFGRKGKQTGNLWCPRKVALIKSGNLVVCDLGGPYRSRMQVFSLMGHFIKSICVRYIKIIVAVTISPDGNIVVADSKTCTVYILDESSGSIVHCFCCGNHVKEPSDITVHNNEYYVCDYKGHSVEVYDKIGHHLRSIGDETLINFPSGIDISTNGKVYVGDSHGNRLHVTVFTSSGKLVAQFRCNYVKVSRICELKLTDVGNVLTLSKNDHHMLEIYSNIESTNTEGHRTDDISDDMSRTGQGHAGQIAGRRN